MKLIDIHQRRKIKLVKARNVVSANERRNRREHIKYNVFFITRAHLDCVLLVNSICSTALISKLLYQDPSEAQILLKTEIGFVCETPGHIYRLQA